MKRYRMIFLFLLVISIPVSLNTTILHGNDKTEIKQKILTQKQAAILASKIANEKFQEIFSISPFTPESYTAELVDNKWCWGKISPAAINGCSAMVTFNKDGSNEDVKVAYHTDILEKEADTQKIPIEIEIIRPDDLNIDDHKEK
jgi:hypothetical protein